MQKIYYKFVTTSSTVETESELSLPDSLTLSLVTVGSYVWVCNQNKEEIDVFMHIFLF